MKLKTKNKKSFAHILLTWAFCLNSQAFELRGYSTIQSSSNGLGKVNQKNLIHHIEITNLNRLNLIDKTKLGVFEVGLELNQLQEWNGDNTSSPYINVNIPFRVTNENPILINKKKKQDSRYLLLGQIDRLSYDFEFKKSNLILGRQQIAFGSSKLSSPLDPFLPFSPAAINTEERPGVDAIRYKKTLGDLSEWGGGVVFGDSLKTEKSAGFIHLKLINEKVETELLLSQFLQSQTMGIGFLKSINGSNSWLEVCHTKPKNEQGYVRATLGGEYQWNQDFYSILEIHHNGAGVSQTSSYQNVISSFAFQSGTVYLLGKNYLNVMNNFQLSPLSQLQIAHTWNLSDYSQLLKLSGVRSLGDNTQLELGWYQGIGPRSDSVQVFESEFGRYGTQLFTKLKVFY